VRYELPGGLSDEEQRAVIAALERHFAERDARPNAWAMAGRMEGVREGTLQSRRYLRDPWSAAARAVFAKRGTEPISGRGDTA
jgi:hypothetical protein